MEPERGSLESFRLFQTFSLLFLLVPSSRWSGLGPWEVVAAGGLGGAVGILQSCHELPTEAPSEAQLLVLETMTGWEETTLDVLWHTKSTSFCGHARSFDVLFWFFDCRDLSDVESGLQDIPANINAILLPAGQAVDTLSHVAIRARNQEVGVGQVGHFFLHPEAL